VTGTFAQQTSAEQQPVRQRIFDAHLNVDNAKVVQCVRRAAQHEAAHVPLVQHRRRTGTPDKNFSAA
jgi:hypothetical protein